MDVCILDSKRLLDVEQKFKLAGVIALNVSKDGKDSLVLKCTVATCTELNHACRCSSLFVGSHN